MNCQKCQSDQIVSITGHCVDRFTAEYKGQEYGPDYVNACLGIGKGDMIEISYCLICGRIQGDFPIDEPDFYEECDHDWVSAKNEVCTGGYVCLECDAVKAELTNATDLIKDLNNPPDSNEIPTSMEDLDFDEGNW